MRGMRRGPRRALALGTAAVAGAFAAAAAADTIVSVPSASTLKVDESTVSAGGDGIGLLRRADKTLLVHQLHLGDAPIRENNGTCDGNFVLNEVSCRVNPSTIRLTFGDHPAEVRVQAPEYPPAGGCFVDGIPPRAPDILSVVIRFGNGDDAVNVDSSFTQHYDCPAALLDLENNRILPRLDVDGGQGADVLNGGEDEDTIRGGPNNDTIQGNAGNDFLQGEGEDDTILGATGQDLISGGPGRDTINGGANNDDIVPGPGNDSVTGGSGDDTLHTAVGDGADVLDGGPGTDTVDYSTRTAPLFITENPAGTPDGEAGEGDDVSNIEHIIGGSGGDTILASGTIDGREGADSLSGRGGTSDTLNGGPGGDTIDAVDGIKDTITCGPDRDIALVDLKDTGIPADCEVVSVRATDDSPPGMSTAARLTSHGLAVRFHCPADARPACRGTLSVRARPGGAELASRTYALVLGRTTTLAVPLVATARAGLRRAHRVDVATVERGHSRKGPRRSDVQFPLAR
ncbi:MAG: calcium-binding protein [Thermoleophilia bacterium]